MAADLILRLPCGCARVIYQGELIAIPFSRLPKVVGEVMDDLERSGCQCRNVA